MNKADVIVIGGGVIGLSVAWHLAKRNKKVLVLEKSDVASGSAGATDGVVGYHTKKPGKQMDLAVASVSMFKNLHEELDFDIEYGFEAGGMQPVENELEWNILSEIADEQRKSGVDIRMVKADEALKIEPFLSPDIYGALYSPTGGKVNPLNLTMAYAKAAKALGAEIRTGVNVEGFIIENDEIRGVKTNLGEFYADIIVNSAGARAGELAKLAGLDLPIKPRKGQLAVTEPVGEFMKATLQCARYNVIKFRPESITDESVLKLGASLSIEQTEDGGVIIGGTREFEGFEDENTFEAIDAMMKRAARFFPALREVSVIRFFSGFRPYTPDGMPLIGEVKGLKGFFMSAGHEGDGIALSPITGKLVSELICDGKSSMDIEAFSPNRFLSV